MLVIAALLCAAFSSPSFAQVVVPSATGVGYGGSGGFDSNTSWLTSYDTASGKAGTAIRVFPAPFVDTTDTADLADPAKRYRYLPFAFYLYPDHMKAHMDAPVHYNMHYDVGSGNIAYSTIASFDIESPGLAFAFKTLYAEGSRLYEENLFVKRMTEMNIEGKDFKLDWAATTEPRLVKEFFFSESIPTYGEWRTWFGDDWEEANLAIIRDYCSAATYAAMMSPSFVGGSGGGTWLAPDGSPMMYELPSKTFNSPVPEDNRVSYHDLYNELVGMFSDTGGDITWSLIWEPIADYYPSGETTLRAWSSASDVAQVLSEKSYETLSLYKDAHLAIVGSGEAIAPLKGNYTRYFAQLFYALRNTSVFDNFLFRQTRAIFTNNYSGSDYVAGQFLLADSLKPEVNNDDGYLGGWAIVYLRDLVKKSAKVDAIRYGLLVDLSEDTVRGRAYGNMSAFSSAPPHTRTSWHQHPSGVTDEAYLDLRPTSIGASINTGNVGKVLGVSDLFSYRGLYVATQAITLNDAWLSASFGRNDMSPDPSLLDSSLLEPILHPVGGNVIGSGKYEATEASLRAYMDAAGLLICQNVIDVSRASVAPSERSDDFIDASVTLNGLSGIEKGKSGVEFAVKYLSSSSHLSSSQVKNSSGVALTALDDGQPLLSLNGTMPISYAIKLPQQDVTAKIITITTGDTDYREQEFLFPIDELFTYLPYASNSIVLGWHSSSVDIDLDDLLDTASHLTAVLSEAEAMLLRPAYGADKAFLIDDGDVIQFAASEDGDGYTGGTAVIITAVEADIDLVMHSVDAWPSHSPHEAEAEMVVENRSSGVIDTRIALLAQNTDLGRQSFTIPVSLPPGHSFITQTVTIPDDGGDMFFVAEVNPAPYDVDEIDYTNNKITETIAFPEPPDIDPLDPSCVNTFTWVERRAHTWSIYYPPPAYSNWCGSTSYYYCVHEYRYQIKLTPTLTYDYRYDGVEYHDEDQLHALKSGYGFTPKVSLDYSGIQLLSERRIAGTSCYMNPDATSPPSTTSQATVVLPTVASLSWYGSWRGAGHSLDDYIIYNPEKHTSQYHSGIAMEHSGATGGADADTQEYLPAANPLSNSNLRNIYAHVVLRDGNHDFRIELTGGSISYRVNFPSYRYRSVSNPWGGCPTSEAVEITQMNPVYYTFLNFNQCLGLSIDGRVPINGTMYEDDFTGEGGP